MSLVAKSLEDRPAGHGRDRCGHALVEFGTDLFEDDDQVGVGGLEARRQPSPGLLDRLAQTLDPIARDPEHGLGHERDRVGPPATVAAREAHALEVDLLVGQDLDQRGDRVGPANMDVDAAVTTAQASDGDAHGLVTAVMLDAIEVPAGVELTTAGTRQIDPALGLGVGG